MRCHEVDYKVILRYIQMVGIAIDPDEAVIAETDAMTYLEQDIYFETKLGDGSSSGVMGKLFGSGSRVFTGESVFLTHSTTRKQAKTPRCFCCTLSRLRNLP